MVNLLSQILCQLGPYFPMLLKWGSELLHVKNLPRKKTDIINAMM